MATQPAAVAEADQPDDRRGSASPAETPIAISVTELLGIALHPVDAGCSYLFGGLDVTADALHPVARLLADDAMRLRCGSSPALSKWRARRDGLAPREDDLDRREIEVFVAPAFGLRTSPDLGKTRHHVQGFVAELLWNRLILDRTETPDGRRLTHTQEVKGDPTGTGGDGFVVYEVADGTLVFRLWEIKKHLAKEPISAKIKEAADQLAEHGARYLAMLTGPGSAHSGALGKLYGDLVRLWLERSPRAGIGISITTSAEHAPAKHPAFQSIAKVFPDFPNEGQREAAMIVLPDFASFSEAVREAVWSGL